MSILNMMVAFNSAAYDEELSNLTIQGALDGVNAGTIDIEDGTGTLDPDGPQVQQLPYRWDEQPNAPAAVQLPYVWGDEPDGPAVRNLVYTRELPSNVSVDGVQNLVEGGDVDAPEASTEEGAALPETSTSPPDNEANTTDTPAAVLNKHFGAALGNDSIAVRMDNGTHTLLVNAEGQAVGYLHYNEETGLVHTRVANSENPLPQDIENLFTNAESPQVAYAEPTTEEVATSEADAPVTDAPTEELAVASQGFTGPPAP
ncbi:MAG: hypothetical protein CMH25_02250 [Micavibrio sp.]|nr:hypothetical protein [Micavibrio sp.]|tara:strand:+ start:443301 stop:444077 length:777 start_codon:yes stop_codon:yes gene_type:complete